VIKTSETQSQTEKLEPTTPHKKSGQKSIFALSVFALGINAASAAYTMSPSDFAWPNIGGVVATLLPHERAPTPIPDTVVAALNDIQSTQQHNAAELQGNGFLLKQNTALLQQNASLFQQNTALLQQDATKLDTLRSSLTDERSDVKSISAQLSTLIAKVDSLQRAMKPELTSSIPKGRARARLSGIAHKRLARPLKPEGLMSVGGVPLTAAPASVASVAQRAPASVASVAQPGSVKR
jgi:hypothetical protein